MNEHAKALLKHMQMGSEDPILEQLISPKKKAKPAEVLDRDMIMADKLYIVYELLTEMESEIKPNTELSASTRIYFSGLEDIADVINTLVPGYLNSAQNTGVPDEK